MKTFLSKLETFGKLPLYAMLILIVFAALYILWDSNKSSQKLLGNDLSYVEAAIRETSSAQIQIQQQTNEVLRENAKAIVGNTEVLRSLQTIIIQNGRTR